MKRTRMKSPRIPSNYREMLNNLLENTEAERTGLEIRTENCGNTFGVYVRLNN